MAELPSLSADDFDAFFTAIHGRPPFPWQSRLAAQLAAGEGWPEVLDLPTGSGKTAAIDVAVFQLALEAGSSPRRAPLRIVYVVDRRTIVDQAHQRAEAIRTAIDETNDRVLAAVRARLASYGREGIPLRTALLRGAIARSDLWARSPDQPLVAVSTVDQVGSRLLFRGYGVSDSMKPVHAGLLGNDVLYLLDEVHLSEPFRQTLAAVGGRYACTRRTTSDGAVRWAERLLERPFEVVEMSATPGAVRETAFRLASEDEQHPVLARRLNAKKLTTVASANARGFAAEIEKHVKVMAAAPGACVGVVVNRVATARELHRRLSAGLKDAEVHLLTGRMRPLDRDRLEKTLFPRICAGRERDPEQAPVVVVATQCIEAGADFDFDALVTECASLDALRQRFGRLDRLGESLVGARAVVVARTDSLNDDPVYGKALGATWRWLEEAASSAGGELDFGIRGLPIPNDPRDLLAPRPSAPTLLPSHLDAWVQTSPRPTPDPDVALWLHGPDRGVADVQVIWRADLSSALLQRALEESGAGVSTKAVLGAVQAVPPASGEAMSVPLFAVRRWLSGNSESDVFDVEGVSVEANESGPRKPEDGVRPAVVWRGDASAVIEPKAIGPGDTIVVPTSYGGIASGTWAPTATDPTSDLAELAAWKQRGRAVLRLRDDVVRGLFGPSAPEAPKPASVMESEEIDDRASVVAWLDALPTADLAGDAYSLATFLRAQAGKRGLRVERLPNGLDGEGEYFLVTSRRRVRFDGDEVSSEDDQASFTGVEVELDAHLDGVRATAGEFADRLNLPPELAADVRLAGRWHDVGKIDPRFQRLLQGGSEFKTLVQEQPLAKSAVPMNDWRKRQNAEERSGYPRGARHEVMSLALMSSAEAALAPLANDWDLVQHLVASHHGRCRPLAPWIPDPEPVEMRWELDDIAVEGVSAHELARLDSGVADRFWRLVRRYGWWGLAWLEAIFRLADHRRSEEEQRARGGAA